MSQLCRACRQFEAPIHRGVFLCRDCTRTLMRLLRNPASGMARMIRSSSYAEACDLCGEHENRRILDHPEWGRICEVDVREAAGIHRLPES